MDFRDSPVEAAFRAEARAFLAAHPPAKMPDYFASADGGSADGNAAGGESAGAAAATLALWRSWQQTLHAHGWAAITWPQAFGGRGLGPIEQIIWNQELARTGMGESLFVVGIGMAGPTIIAHGTPEQKSRLLSPMLRGDEIWCQLFSEPGAGSDLASLATRAMRDGDDWIVTGQKTWCSGGHYADFGILLVRSDPKVPKHAGITYLVADMRAPGVSVRPLRQMTGGLHFNEVFLDGVRIPDAQRLGPVGGGWGVAMTTLMNERMAIGGIERWLDFDALVRHAQANRERLDPVTRDELARLYTWVRTLELLNAKVITQLGQGKFAAAESSVMKLALARILTKASELGLRLVGPDALARDGAWQNQFLGAPALHIAGGTDEVQKNVAAERVLGLPREPRRDKDVAFEDLPRG